MAKKTAKKVESPKVKEKKQKEKQLYWIFGIMAGLIFLVLVLPWMFKQFNTFEYQGLTFTKERFGKIPVYHYYYYFSDENKKLFQYNLYLREDPRENNVSVEGKIIFDRRVNYVTVNGTEFEKCENSAREFGRLGEFLSANQIEVNAGSIEEEFANKNNLTYVTCQTNPNNMVMVIKGGSETKIVNDRNRCYTITVAQCNLLDAVEKFMVQSIIDAREEKQDQAYFALN